MNYIKSEIKTSKAITDYDQWRTQAPLVDPNWQPKFNSGLAPVGCLLWVKVGECPTLCRRTGFVTNRGNIPEFRVELTGDILVGDFMWCIY